MQISLTHDYGLIKEIVTTPRLFELTYGQACNKEDVDISDKNDYLVLSTDKEIVGCFSIREVTNILLEAHIAILPHLWGTEISQDAVNTGHAWAKDKGYKAVMTSVPANCVHMLKWLTRMDYKPCGTIKNGIVYNKHLVSLILFEYTLDE